MPKINSLEVVHQDTNKDPYQNLHDILVALNQSLAVDREIVDGEARVAIENLLEMYVNDKEAFLRSLQTVTAKFKASEAKYEEEILLQASALEALAKRTSTLTAQTENNIASVREYSEAVASEVERKVTTYSQDDAPTENLAVGDLWYDTNNSNKLSRWNGLVWVPTDDTRIAQTYARWGVQVDANGNVAGIQLNSDSLGTSEFTVLAGAFRVYNTSTGTDDVIFLVKDGVVTPKNLRVDDSSGNWLLKVSSDMTGALLYKPTLSMGTASNVLSPSTPAFKASSYAYEALRGESISSNTNPNGHGVRGINAYLGTSGLVGVANGYDFYAEGAGTNYGPFTGAHDALVIKDAVYELGDIVVDKACIAKKNISNTLFEVETSSTINQKGVVGVVAKDNGLLSKNYPPTAFGFDSIETDEDNNLVLPPNAEYDIVKNTHNYITMNASGEGQINVCGENGSISKGDLIVTSSIPGKGMKQADDVIRSYTVAKAREDVTFSSPTEVKQVACIYLCG